MGVYIKNWSIANWKELLKWAKFGANNAMIGEFAEVEEVPPHGRLIDADKLVDSFEPSDFWNSDAEDNCFAAVRIVHNAPTIIPASDEDTNVLGKEEANDG